MYSTKCWPVTSRGQYVSFIDSDDFMDLVAYEKIIKVLKNNQADILDFGWRYVSETGEKTENSTRTLKSCC